MNVLTLDAKSRVLIPADVRAALGIGPGDDLLLVREGGRMYLLTEAAMLDALAAAAEEEHARGETMPLRQLMAEDAEDE